MFMVTAVDLHEDCTAGHCHSILVTDIARVLFAGEFCTCCWL